MLLHLFRLSLLASVCLYSYSALAKNDLTSVSKTVMSSSGDDKVSFEFNYHGDVKGPRAQVQFSVPPQMLQYEHFLRYVEQHPDEPVPELLKTFTNENRKLRIISRTPAEDTLADLVTLFDHPDDIQTLQTRVQATKNGPEPSKDHQLMFLPAARRNAPDFFSIIASQAEFESNFHVVTDGLLRGLNWSNIVAAGSAVTASLFAAPSENASSLELGLDHHRSLVPTIPVDLFLYGLEDIDAVEKLIHIEECIKKAVGSDVLTIRTAQRITIVSQGPYRDVTISLRMHANVPDIISSQSIDSAAVVYDGSHFLASPRSLAAIMTLTNTIDLSRSSPTYEDELAQAALLGFSVYWPKLQRDLVDPTVYSSVVESSAGLAKLLLFERCIQEHSTLDQPDRLHWPETGPVKSENMDLVGIREHLYGTDLRKNALWLKESIRRLSPPHRHPAFWGSMKDVVKDQCGLCPKRKTASKYRRVKLGKSAEAPQSGITGDWINGPVNFHKQDDNMETPLRIEKAKPEASSDQSESIQAMLECKWTATTYQDLSAALNSAIINADVNRIEELVSAQPHKLESRDSAGRTPLYFAVLVSATEVVKQLVKSGANPFALHDNEMTPLHLAAKLGQYEAIRSMLIDSTVDEKDILEKVSEGQMPLDTFDPVSDAPNLGIHNTLKNPAASVLHLAVMNGHTETVRVLVKEFGADPNTLMEIPPMQPTGGHFSQGKEPSDLSTLSIAMRLPTAKAVEMVQLLIELGASPLQIDKSGLSGLYYAASKNFDLLSAMTKDRKLLQEGVNAVMIPGKRDSRSVSVLQAAVDSGDLKSVRYLLDNGAILEGSFEDFKRAYRSKNPPVENPNRLRRPWTDEELPGIYKSNTVSPIAVAISNNNPQLAQALVEAGADVNILTPATYGYIQNSDARNVRYIGSILDALDSRIELLRGCKTTECLFQLPQHSYDSEIDYVHQAEAQSYEYFVVSSQLQGQKRWDSGQPKPRSLEGEKGFAERSEYFDMLIAQYEDLKEKVLAAGGKTLKAMYPELKDLPEQQKDPSLVSEVWQPSKYLSVWVQSEERLKQYRSLFEAAWNGDLHALRSFLLESKQPLNAAVKDSLGLSPFTVAMLRGHYEAAAVVLDAALAQYAPLNTTKRSYGLQCIDKRGLLDALEEPDNVGVGDSHPPEEPIPIRSTFGPVRLLDLSIRRSYSSVNLSSAVHGIPDADGGNVLNQKSRGLNFTERHEPETLLELALHSNDMDLLKQILQLGERYTHGMAEVENEPRHSYSITITEVFLAIRLGRTEMLAELIRSTGAGLPWGALTNDLGLSRQKWDGFYNVPGSDQQHSMDWLLQPSDDCDGLYDAYSGLIIRPGDPPLLIAIRVGSLETVKWLVSEEAVQCYRSFVNNNPTDRRLARLAEHTGDAQSAVAKWLSVHSSTVLHQVSFREENPETMSILEYLLSTFPSALDSGYPHGQHAGQTPLHFALSHGKLKIFTHLLRAGADPSILSTNGESILHAPIARWQSVLSQLDPQLIKNLATLPSNGEAGFLTPLEAWTSSIASWSSSAPEALEGILSFIGPQALTPKFVHTLARWHHHRLLRYVVQLRPDLLGYEDVNGKTPLENLQDEIIAMMSRPSPSPSDHRRSIDQSFGYTELVMRPVSSFAKDKEKIEGRDEALWNTVGVCQEFGKDVKRRLITPRERAIEMRRAEAKKRRDEEWKSALMGPKM